MGAAPRGMICNVPVRLWVLLSILGALCHFQAFPDAHRVYRRKLKDAVLTRNPMTEKGWHLVAHLSEIRPTGRNRKEGWSGNSLLSSNGGLDEEYNYGEYTWYPSPTTSDFQIDFPVKAKEIMFAVGDGSLWAICDYQILRNIIDRRRAETRPNIKFTVGILNVTAASSFDDNVMVDNDSNEDSTHELPSVRIEDIFGNVLSRPGLCSDPLITLFQRYRLRSKKSCVIWGDNIAADNTNMTPKADRSVSSSWQHLGGVNVFVRRQMTRTPLEEMGWYLVAHMSDRGGLFGGDGKLLQNYSYGEPSWYPMDYTPDFQVVFPIANPQEILFVTGDGTIWVLANYNRLRTLIDTQGNVEGYNIDLAVGCNGDVVERRGNVFSRRNEKYDPILSILGESSKNGTVIWGGNKLLVKNGSVLKNERGGLNVFVRKQAPSESVPSPSPPPRLKSDLLTPTLQYTVTPRGTSNGTVVSYWPPQPSKLPNDTSHKNATSVPSPSPIAPSGGRLAPFSSENHSAQQVFVFAVNNSMIILDDCQVLRPPSIELWRNITCNYMLRAGLKQKYGLDDLNFIIKVVSQSTSTSELNSSASDNRTLQMLPSPSDISTSLAITFATEVLIRSQEKNIYSEKIFRDAMEEIVHKNVSYLKDLKRTGDSDFKNVGTVQVFTNGVAIQPREAVPAGISSSSRGVGILSSCIIGATLLLVTAAWGCNHKLNPKKKVSDELMRSWDVATTASAFHEPCFQGKTYIDLDPQDEISTLEEPVCPLSIEDDAADGEQDILDSVGDGTVDYEYSRNLGNSLGDPSHASLDGTLGDASSRIENSLARGVLAEQSTIFSDDASFEAQYNETGSSVEVDVIDVLIPPGKLGVIIDTPDDSGPPILYAIKDTSCVAHVLKVGDKLIAVDGEDVRGASAIRVSKLIARKSSNQWRTFTILRRNL